MCAIKSNPLGFAETARAVGQLPDRGEAGIRLARKQTGDV